MKQNDPPFVWVLKIKEYFTAPVKNCGTKILFSLSWTNFKGQNCGDLLDKVLVSYCPYQLFTTEMFCPLYSTRQNYLKNNKNMSTKLFLVSINFLVQIYNTILWPFDVYSWRRLFGTDGCQLHIDSLVLYI